MKSNEVGVTVRITVSTLFARRTSTIRYAKAAANPTPAVTPIANKLIAILDFFSPFSTIAKNADLALRNCKQTLSK